MIYNTYELIWLFLIYSFLGWMLETILAATEQRRFVNRGLINGPLCTIYGVPIVILTIFGQELPLFWLFLGAMIVATVTEWISGHMIERFYHERWWDYSNVKWNLDGYICLPASLVWGVLGTISMRWGNGLLIRLYGFLPEGIGHLLVWILAGMLVLSMSVPVYADKSVVVKVEAPADTTDYYMTVDSGGVGVDIYPSTDEKGEKLNDKTVKDGTVLHIEGETEKNGETWGYTEYNGRYGYVPLEELRPSRDAELVKAGIAGSTEKETSGVKQGGASDTQNSSAGETQGEAAGMDNTGNAQVQNGEGQGTSAETDSTGSSQAQNGEGQGTSAGADSTGSSQSQNGEGPGTSAGTDSTGSAQAQNGEVQGPPAASDSTDSSQAQSGEVQGPPAAEGTTEGGDYAEEAVTKPVNGTAATSFKEENSWYKSPFIWIGIATVLAVIGILGYHLKKR